MANLQFENDEGSSLGPGISSDEENDFKEARASAAAAAVGNGTASIASGGAGSDDIDSFDDGQCVDRYGFLGGKQFTEQDYELPIEVIRKREMKWLDMIDDWEKWMTKKPKKVRERCRKGIPSSLRGRAWQFLCGSKKLVEQNKGRFRELDEMPGESKWLDVIEKDLDRQFPFHEMFAKRDGHGQQDLFRILKAYSIYNPRDGYCQGQAPVAAVLLMHMPAEEAFWCMVQICERYLTGYYSPGLEAVQVDGEVLFGLIKKTLPATHKHMKKHRIEPILYMTEWFMCIFARTLPWTSVLRVWDMFFCEGVKILFRVALVLLKHTLGHSSQLADSPGLYETMEKLKHIPASIMQEDFLASEMLKLRIFEKDLEAEHSLSLARRKAIRERQMSSENASAMARDIAAKKKKSNRGKNLAKEWEKEKRKREKEKGHQADTDSMISMPNSVDLVEDEEAELEAMAEAEAAEAEPEAEPETREVGMMNNGVQEVVELPDEKQDKKKKKKDKKKKKKEKLEINTSVVNAWQSNDELQSPDYENEYEIVDRFSSPSASPTKSAKSVSRGASDKDVSSEEARDSGGSKKKKKDKKKKSKNKDKEKGSGAAEEMVDDVSSAVTTPEGGIEVGDVKEKKKDKKEKKEKKRKKSKEHAENEVDASGTAWTEVSSHPPSPERQLSDDATSVKSLSKKEKKKEKKEKKEKKKKDKDKDKDKDKEKDKEKDKDKEVEVEKGNGVIRNEYASDENLSPVSPIDFEVVERYKPPTENSRKSSEKRMGLIYSDEQWNGIGSIGPLAEIPSFEEMRKMKKEKEEKKKKDSEPRIGPRSAPTSPSDETKEVWSEHGGGVPHSYSNGMESGNASPLSNGSSDSSRKEMAKKMKKRDYHSFDYGTAV